MAMTPTYNATPSPVAPYRQSAGPGMASAFTGPGQLQQQAQYQAPDNTNIPGAAGATALPGAQYYAAQLDPQSGQSSQVSAQQAAVARQQYMDSLQGISHAPGGGDLANQLMSRYNQATQGQASTDTSAQHYIPYGNMGNAYMTTPGSPTGYMYGAAQGQAGVDTRAWNNIYNPNAYQYGGVQGGATAEENRYAQLAQNTPQMDMTQYNALQNGMGANANAAGADAMGMARATAMGQTPSVANAQMLAGVAATQRAQSQQAAGARGGGANLVAAQQLAASAGQNAQANYVTQAGTQAAQERLNAQQAYGTMANSQQAAYAQQAGLASQNAYQQAGLTQAGQLAYEGMRQGVFSSQQNAQMQGEAQNANTGATAAQLQATKDANDTAYQRQLVGGILTAAGTVGGMAVGGPAGAVAGGAAGKAAAGAVT